MSDEAGPRVLAGGLLASRPATFTSDGSRLAVCCGAVARIYSVATGAPLLELSGHVGETTAVVAPPGAGGTLYTAGSDGTLRLWAEASGECLRVLAAPAAVESIVFAPAPSPLAFLSCHKAGAEQGGRVYCYNLTRGRVLDTLGKSSAPLHLVISRVGSLLAAHERHTVLLWAVGSLTAAPGGPAPGTSMPEALRLHHTKALSCVALAGDEQRLAAGDVTGRILLFHGVGTAAAARAAGDGEAKARCAVTTMHWHASAVGFVAFSPDGSFLLSGGAEAVLVLWRLDSGARTFLPRCGGALRSLAQNPADAANIALACSDNAHRIVNTAAMRCEGAIAGTRPPSLAARGTQAPPAAFAPAAPAWDRRTGGAVLAGGGGMLQWYCLKRDAQLGSLRVLDAAAAPPPPPPARSGDSFGPALPLEGHVAHFALSKDGSDLATLERRCEAGGGEPVETLRFWELPAAAEDGEAASEDLAMIGLGGGAPFLLRTRVETPHTSLTAALAHSPRARLVATAGGGAAEFRLWQRGKAPVGPAASWRCRSVGFFQSRPMHALAFSADGSTLAVAAGDAATLWDPSTNELLAVLHPPSAGPLGGPIIVHLAFLEGPLPAVPLLLAATGAPTSSLLTWHLGTLRLWRHHTLGGSLAAFAAAPPAQRAAAFVLGPCPAAPNGCVLRCGGDDGGFMEAWALPPSREPAEPQTLLFAQLPSGLSDLLVCTADRRFVAASGVRVKDSADHAFAATALRDVSAFTAAFGALRPPTSASDTPGSGVGRGGGSAWRPVVDAPSHALPSLLTLLPAYLSALLAETEPAK